MPIKLTESEAALYESWWQECLKQTGIPNTELVKQISISGYWLAARLAEQNYDQQQIGDILFAHGQMCWPAKDPWAVAEKVLAQCLGGDPPKPGSELAKVVFEEAVGDTQRLEEDLKKAWEE